jgi:hypothetical protein
MATSLTFEIGRRPGVARRQSWTRKPATGMTHAQHNALAGLIHSTGGPRKSSVESKPVSERDGRGMDYVWFAVLALLFLLGSRALVEGIRFVHTADALQIIRHADPHVDVTVTRLPTAKNDARSATPTHSSEAESRTM